MKNYYPGLKEKCREFFSVMKLDLIETAREHGYAIAVHGSLARDIDLIAVPWTDEASDVNELIEALKKSIEKYNPLKVCIMSERDQNPEEKPHGRLAWSFHLGAGPYIDLSVMPKLKKPE